MSNKRLFVYIFIIISLISGVLSIFLFVLKRYFFGIILVFVYYLISIFINYDKDESIKFQLAKNLLFFVFFPFFPVIFFFKKVDLKPLYKPIEVSEHKLIETRNIKYLSIDLAPFNTIIKYGDPAQRKYVVRFVFNSIKIEKMDFIEGVNLIRKALSDDLHPDVLLYASDALTNLENFLISKISFYSENLNSLENYINYAKYIYYYANSGFLAGEYKNEILMKSYKILKNVINTYPDSPRLIIYTLRILESLKDFRTIEELLNKKIKKFKAQEIFEYAIFYYIKQKKFFIVKELISEYIKLGFKPKNESLKYILGG
ncbi:hypothetical protein SAMN02745164_00047 [Marinitoga hydrogenitolerans DSM 16785]|uniref:Uncharacterized protein n=1 Tax=Marinitoga hydrogenitolerans (strain DSM 16785 / JCM 12826 / AT1271) TaxID=1122195 RepID=A0A1M4S5D2_MARH1|nr:hypothetical protein [Marinitoga hydrogenitolerans]SHE27401.1 hypothetical protein SAMN02745164_00047 [Marinitoga hydrogenitolerans DSM 16785]